MALTLGDFQYRFKNIAKMIYLGQLPGAQIAAAKQAHISVMEQNTNGITTTVAGGQTVPNVTVANQFDVNNQVIATLGSQVSSLTTTLASLPTQASTAITSYLQKFIALDLGLTANASLATIGTALATQMAATSPAATVAPSGTLQSNASGIATYFAQNFNIVLNQNASPTIPDAWITPTVV